MGRLSLLVVAAAASLVASGSHEDAGYRRAPEFDCKGLSLSTYHASAESCTDYYVCDVQGRAYVNDCGEFGAFDETTLSCKLADEVDCNDGQRSTSNAGEDSSWAEPQENSDVEDQGNASSVEEAGDEESIKVQGDEDSIEILEGADDQDTFKPPEYSTDDKDSFKVAEDATDDKDSIKVPEDADDKVYFKSAEDDANDNVKSPEDDNGDKEAPEDDTDDIDSAETSEVDDGKDSFKAFEAHDIDDKDSGAIEDGKKVQGDANGMGSIETTREGYSDKLDQDGKLEDDEIDELKGIAKVQLGDINVVEGDAALEQEEAAEPVQVKESDLLLLLVGDCAGKRDGTHTFNACRFYFKCRNGTTVFSRTCPLGTAFDVGASTCVQDSRLQSHSFDEEDFYDLFFSGEEVEDTPDETASFCVDKKDRLKYHTEDKACTSFRTCERGVPRFYDCPAFTIFEVSKDRENGECNHLELAFRRPECVQQNRQLQAERERFRCPKDPASSNAPYAVFADHFLAGHPEDCAKFYICSFEGRGQIPQSCLEPDVFDAAVGLCVHESEVKGKCENFWSNKLDEPDRISRAIDDLSLKV